MVFGVLCDVDNFKQPPVHSPSLIEKSMVIYYYLMYSHSDLCFTGMLKILTY